MLQYAAFLARSLKAASVRSYLNIVGILHKEFGLPNPLLHNWPLKTLLTGINRVKGLSLDQKQPITPDILMRLHTQLDFTSSFDASFWAVCLVAFYGMFRKSHLLPIAANQFNPSKQLTKADFKIFHWGLLITIRWSKTIRFRERVVEFPLPNIPGSKLCPTAAVTHAFRLTASVSHRDSQAFNSVTAPKPFTCLPTVLLYQNCACISPLWDWTPSSTLVLPFRRGGGGGGYFIRLPVRGSY